MAKQDPKDKNLPIDAKLLSDAIIELNISRRSVGLYPADHPIVGESIERAFSFLQKLFELRPEITLGIAKNTLLVDEYQLDRRNPVFKEFSLCLHTKGLAAVKFRKGMVQDELLAFHSLITHDNGPAGKDLAEAARSGNMPHIEIAPIDFSRFGFVESGQRDEGETGKLWHEYIHRILDGTLSENAEERILDIPPSELSSAVNSSVNEETDTGTYDRVITAYLQRQNQPRLNSESFTKFFSFVENLKPEIKKQFLSRTTQHFTGNFRDIEAAIADMTPEAFEQTAEALAAQSSLVPENLQNLMAKFSAIRMDINFREGFLQTGNAQVHDIELGEDIRKIFEQDNFDSFVTDDYRKELNMMLEAPSAVTVATDLTRDCCAYETIDKALLSVIFEVLEEDFITDEEYLQILTKLSEYADSFLQTGRFEEVLEIYNTLSSQAFSGKFRDNASSMVNYFFRSDDLLSRTVSSIRLWGRKDREGAIRLAKALRHYIAPPLLDLIADENDAGMRKFLLSVLGALGPDVIPYAVKNLNDKRWYVVRNMLYLLRKCHAVRQAAHVKKFIKHSNITIRAEALSTLLSFKTPDAIPYLKLYLAGEDAGMLKEAARLAAKYRVVEAVPHLISILEKKDLIGNISPLKMDVIRTLGEIGDAQAVPFLLKLFNSKTLLYRSYLEQLKIEIFRNIGNYPPDALSSLITAGLSSSNEEIRKLCEHYLTGRQKTSSGGAGHK